MTPAKLSKGKSVNTKPRIGLALAGGGGGGGGGLLGAIYEIGALYALDESLNGLSFTRLQHYAGYRRVVSSPQAWLMVPAYGEFLRRSILLPGLAVSALWRATFGGKSLLEAVEALGPVLSTGIFSNNEINPRLTRLLAKPGRTNDFRQLCTRLTLVATNLDSGDATPLGQPGWDHVPIFKAVQASSALPGLFPPVEIENHYFVDGALKKTMHAGVAMDEGIDLMFCLNPLGPFNATRPSALAMNQRVMRRGLPPKKQVIARIVDGGLPAVLSQALRAVIHSRLELGMKHYEHAYQQTRQMLRSRKTTLAAKLARHTVSLNMAALDDPTRHLVATRPAATRVGRAIASLEEAMEDLNHTIAPGPRAHA